MKETFFNFKNSITVLLLSVSCLFAVSCQTTEKTVVQQSEPVQAAVSAVPEDQPVAESPDPVQELSPEDLFRQKIHEITLHLLSSPKGTTKHYAFKEPYVLEVKKEDASPVADFSVNISYPESRTDGVIVYKTVQVKTDADGKISFDPPVPEFSFDDKVTFYPAPVSSDPAIVKIATESSVSAPWMVKTDYTWKGGLISLVDYNTHGNPITTNTVSSSKLLMDLIQNGFSSIGNADFTAQIRTGDRNAVYTAAKDLVGHSAKYLIYGTVKYVDTPHKTDEGFACTLQGDITCLNMDDGSVLFKTEQLATAEETAEWKVTGSARQKLADKLCHLIIYGL
ncbi:MAG: hypothetical protein LKF96_09675 [Treponema sp.]|jgi:hypothetical protein|nr:hypothetical protein [Treponema sp.]